MIKEINVCCYYVPTSVVACWLVGKHVGILVCGVEWSFLRHKKATTGNGSAVAAAVSWQNAISLVVKWHSSSVIAVKRK